MKRPSPGRSLVQSEWRVARLGIGILAAQTFLLVALPLAPQVGIFIPRVFDPLVLVVLLLGAIPSGIWFHLLVTWFGLGPGEEKRRRLGPVLALTAAGIVAATADAAILTALWIV